jgi:Tol biopolymer transport system component/DNA-binding winged helix-turn-helix (wHTH) protein
MESSSPHPRHAVLIGNLVVEPGRLLVRHPDGERALPPKALAVLLELSRHPGRTVSRDALLEAVWSDSYPTPDALTHAIKELRRVLGDDPREPRFIETVPRLGYRLMVDVHPAPEVQAAGDAAAPVVVASARSPRWRVGLLSLLLAAPVLALAVMLMRERSDAGDAAPWPPRIQPVTADRGWETMASLSPDGSAFAYMAAGPEEPSFRIRIRAVGAPAGRRLSLREDSGADGRDVLEIAPAWSNDGRRIAYARFDGRQPARCRIVVSDAFVDAEREIGDCDAAVPQILSWSHRDTALLLSVPADDGSVAGRTLARMPIDGGEPRRLDYPRQPGDIDIEPRMSPDGRWLAFRRGANPYSDVYLMSAAGGPLRRLTHWALPITRFAWLPDSRDLLVARRDQRDSMWRVAITPPFAISASVDGIALPDGAFPAAARHDRAVIVTREQSATRIVAHDRRDGRRVQVEALEAIASSRSDWDPAISTDGRRLAFVSDRGGQPALYLADLERGSAPREIARHEGMRPRAPRWSADGSKLGYIAQGPGASHAFLHEHDSGRLRRVGGDDERIRAIEFASDGALLVASDRGGGWNLWRVEVERWVALDVPHAIRGVLAMDGSLLFTRADDPHLYRRPAGQQAYEVLLDDLWLIDEPAWSVHGETLCVVRMRSRNPIGGQHVDCLDGELGASGWQAAFPQPVNFRSRSLSLAGDRQTVYSVEQERREADLYLWTW